MSISGVYKVPHSPTLGGGEVYQIYGEEFQVLKWGRTYGLLGRILSGKKGKGK